MIGSIDINDWVLVGSIKNDGTLVGRITQSAGMVLVGHILSSGAAEDYTGEYNITPQITSQTMHTRDKRMIDDLVVNSIPYFNVSNPQGGETIIIGGEISWQ